MLIVFGNVIAERVRLSEIALNFKLLHGKFKILTGESSTSTLANITFWYC